MKSLFFTSVALSLCTGAAYAWSPVDKTEFTLVLANPGSSNASRRMAQRPRWRKSLSGAKISTTPWLYM